MRANMLRAIALCGPLLFVGSAATGWAAEAEPPQPSGRMTFTLGGSGVKDPAQAEAAAAGQRQAEAAAAEAQAQADEARARQRAEGLNQEGLTQQRRPLTHFGVLTGPLSPTTPFSLRR